ncbi:MULTISPECIES: hypothetical protein [Acinetobacter]|jgi:hypothetical protein|uniref:hypothetical protein n=1 Tax=Acinetobacter TaxID=469 RepID=UPI000369BCF2|nr:MULTISPECIES: hypothetical protein [Acinetobacter]PTV49165.1 hypothetical protein DBL04_18105 [Acinetobacter seifertii]
MRNFLIMVFTVFLGTSVYAMQPKNGEEPTYCEQVVALHGFLSRAQYDCNYRYYSKEFMRDVKKCTIHELGDEYAEEVLKFGISQFEEREDETPKAQLCKEILKDFPNYVKK